MDTHKHAHTVSVVNAQGAELSSTEAQVDADGYRRMLAFAQGNAPSTRVWAVEGANGYGSGLARQLIGEGERVVEIDRPKRPARRNGAKSDRLDATRAAREYLARDHATELRARGQREAVRAILRTREGAVHSRTKALNHLQALVMTAPEQMREKLRGLTSQALAKRCARLQVRPTHTEEESGTVIALRCTARRVLALNAEVTNLDDELAVRVPGLAPALLEQHGVGAGNGAEILCAWSHPGRVRSEAAFANLARTSPIPASSGQTVRYRLNRGGDRKLNRAIHFVVIVRTAHHGETRRYIERRRAEGKSTREIRRCLKRFVARQLLKCLKHRTFHNPNRATDRTAVQFRKHRPHRRNSLR